MDEKPLDLALLKQFSPLDGLKAENLHALAKKTSLRELAEGKLLFKEAIPTSARTSSCRARSRSTTTTVCSPRCAVARPRHVTDHALPAPRFNARASDPVRYISIAATCST